MDKQKINERITLLKQQRDQLISDANRGISELNGRIAELELMLAETETPPTGVIGNAQA